MVSLGKGVVFGYSRNHKSNIKISTDSELVGEDYVLPQVLLFLYFIEARGYPVDQNIM